MNKCFSLLILLAVLFSCKEDDMTEEVLDSIQGGWILKTKRMSECDDPANNGVESIQCTDGNCVRYFFSNDSTALEYRIENTGTSNEENELGIYEINDDKLTLCLDVEGELECRETRVSVSMEILQITVTDPTTGCSVLRTLERDDS